MFNLVYLVLFLFLVTLNNGLAQDAIQAEVSKNQMQGNAIDNSMRLERPNIRESIDSNQLNNDRLPAYANINNNSVVNSNAPLAAQITKEELIKLSQHEVVLVIDKSGSMDTQDCPRPKMNNDFGRFLSMPFMMTVGGNPFCISRWQWCQLQLMNFANLSKNYLDQGMSVVLFSDFYRVFKNVQLDDIEQIFQQNHPSGGTNTTAAMDSVFMHYFIERQQNPQTKPILVAIITDGIPNNPQSLRQSLIQATFNMKYPNEISIVILQIGNSFSGYRYLEELDNNLVQEGAKYDIVKVKPFKELTKIGLSKGIIDAIYDDSQH